MNIIILGSSGMLGWAVGKYFLEEYGEDNVHLSYRNQMHAYGKNHFYFDAKACALDFKELYFRLSPIISEGDYIINCIGVIKPNVESVGVENTILINSVFPWVLATFCKNTNTKLIQITTDCVFSGEVIRAHCYTENDPHDPKDVYGKSKSLGEPTNCMVLRTSIIGEEFHGNLSLVAWAKSQREKEVTGFGNHLWNGITTKTYAKVCDTIIKNNWYKEDAFHIFSPEFVDKDKLLHLVNDRFNLGLKINRGFAPAMVNRVLGSVKDLVSKLSIPTLEKQVEEM
jgi:dTDP-4-dehydrorhamnose reductase